MKVDWPSIGAKMVNVTNEAVEWWGTDGDDVMSAPPVGEGVWGWYVGGYGRFLGYALHGGGGNDVLSGADDGNDGLDGGYGDDQLFGGGGDDSLQGGMGLERIYGGAGNDTVYVVANYQERTWLEKGNVAPGSILDGGAGVDAFRVSGVTYLDLYDFTTMSVTGWESFSNTDRRVGNVHFTGEQMQQFTHGIDSFARIYITTPVTLNLSGIILGDATRFYLAEGQNSIILPSDRSARVWGNSGDDRIVGGARYSQIDGGAGNDWIDISGATGEVVGATLNGGAGDDTILGSAQADTINGDDGSIGWTIGGYDVIRAGGGDDLIADSVRFLPGASGGYIDGGDGIDRLSLSNGSILKIMQGSILVWQGGQPMLDFLSGAAMTVTVQQYNSTTTAEVDIVNVEILSGVTTGISLFNNNNNDVNFNTLKAGEPDAIIGLAATNPGAIYTALDGADIVTLPDSDTLSNGYKWQAGTIFDAGQGNDTIKTGNLTDLVQGGAGDDIIHASIGADKLWGGDGNDLFDYHDIDATTLASSSQTIIGGAGTDMLWLPGSASDYGVMAEFRTDGDLYWNIDNKNGFKIDVTGVETVKFKDAPNNSVTGNIVTMLVDMAEQVYGINPPKGFLPGYEKLLVGSPPPAGLVVDATTNGVEDQYGWRPLSALELGMKIGGQLGATQYSLVDGLYQAINPNETLNGDVAEANAIVMIGAINGVPTLSIAFRGTDQLADFRDYRSFALDHYSKFQPLITAIDKYIADNGIKEVLVAGHSLGGGMVDTFMASHSDSAGVSYHAVTIGSPGRDIGGDGNVGRLLNFGNMYDPVFNIAPIASGAQGLTTGLGAVAQLIQNQVGIRLDSGATLSDLLYTMQPKGRSGSDIIFETQTLRDYDELMLDHKADLYLERITQLVDLATNGPERFQQSALGQSLKAGQIYSGSPVYIAMNDPNTAVGGTYGTISFLAKTSWVFGGAGNERFDSTGGMGVAAAFVGGAWGSGAVYHEIDGGVGLDTLVLPGLASSWSWSPVGDGFQLDRGGVSVAFLHKVEKLVFAGLTGQYTIPLSASVQAGDVAAPAAAFVGAPVVYLDGSAAVAQQVAADATSFTIAAGTDYVLAGTANVAITGTGGDDIVVLGSGTQRVDAGAGNDMVLVETLAEGMPAGTLTVQGGAGDDGIYGDGARADRVVAQYGGNHGDYGVSLEPDGTVRLTDLRAGSPDGSDDLHAVTRFLFTDGEFSLRALTTRAINGTAGNDVLASTAYWDRLAGGAGDDVYVIDSQDDVVIELAGEGRDTIMSSVTLNLSDHIENVVLIAGAGAIHVAGNILDNDLQGNEADNMLFGAGGDDVLSGGGGADLLDGSDGRDTASYAMAGSGVSAYLTWIAGNSGDAAGDRYAFIENLHGSAHADILSGDADANVLNGADGNDWLAGLDGHDYLLGAAGNDVLSGGNGFDRMDGGDGIDVVSYRDAAAYGYSLDWGYRPLLTAGQVYGVLVDADTPSNNFGEAGGDTLENIENIWGSRHNDVIFGADGVGGQVYGFEGNDVLAGRGGNDVFYGGTGADYMQGGAGADEFFYLSWYDHTNAYGTVEPYEGGDTITDFASGVDRITVSRYWFGFGDIAGPAAALTTDNANFVTNGVVSSSKPAFLWDAASGQLNFDPDGNGAGAAVLLATLQAGATLTLSDIWTA